MDWKQWCADIWAASGNAWILRTGQDHYYRAKVVIPALLSILQEKTFTNLVDVGSGDGYSTELLLSELEPESIEKIVLIDQSAEQLERAVCTPHLATAATIIQNVVDDNWSTPLLLLIGPKLIISIFVLQEVPTLAPFFAQLANVLKLGDLFTAVIVHPEFSRHLAARGEIIDQVPATNADDFTSAGKYPIGVTNGTIYLPHFQRDFDTYRRIAAKHGLAMRAPIALQVPNTPEAHAVFATTVYGTDIINSPSSALLIFEKLS